MIGRSMSLPQLDLRTPVLVPFRINVNSGCDWGSPTRLRCTSEGLLPGPSERWPTNALALCREASPSPVRQGTRVRLYRNSEVRKLVSPNFSSHPLGQVVCGQSRSALLLPGVAENTVVVVGGLLRVRTALKTSLATRLPSWMPSSASKIQ